MAEDPDEIREAIDQTRTEIGETLEAIGEKVDLKARAADKVTERQDQLRAMTSDVKGKVTEAGHRIASDPRARPRWVLVAGVVAVVVLVATVRMRHGGQR